MRIAKLVIAGTIAVAGLGVAGVASAAPEPCHTGGWTCIYGSNKYEFKIGERSPHNGVANIGRTHNDQMDSWRNENGVTDSAWYEDNNGRGDCHNMRHNSHDPNINFRDSDQLSSWKTNVGCP